MERHEDEDERVFQIENEIFDDVVDHEYRHEFRIDIHCFRAEFD